jgi:hypothetical protein
MSRAQQTSTVEQNTGGAVAPKVAGKNKVINGDFGIWQRGTTFSGIGSNVYTADRWCVESTGTCTVTQQSFTPGTAPVAGYEGQYFLRQQVTSASSVQGLNHRIEDIRTFANQTVTVSFWAKAAASTSLTFLVSQFFSGGQQDNLSTVLTIGTSWQRYTVTGTIGSIAGFTLPNPNYLSLRFLVLTNTTYTLDIWGVQMEQGSVATPFTTASNTVQGELALCQRYYQLNDFYVEGYTLGSGTTGHQTVWRVTPRTTPTITFITNPFTTNLNSYGVVRMTAQGAEHYIVATSTGAAYAFSGVYSVSAEL